MRCLASILAVCLYSSGAAAADLFSLEAALLAEVNRMREDPRSYAGYLEEHLKYYRGNVLEFPGTPRIVTAEGPPALEEAAAALRAAAPLEPLALSEGLSQAARDHVEDQGRRGEVGHLGAGGSSASVRASRYSRVPAAVGENIIYGTYNAAWMLLRFLADNGVPGRGHRKNLLSPDYRYVGIACGPHAAYQGMCVMDFARVYAEKPALVAAGHPVRQSPSYRAASANPETSDRNAPRRSAWATATH